MSRINSYFLVAWFRHDASENEKKALINYLQKEGDLERNINWDLIRLVLSSVANTAILLFQDILDLDEGCRINDPYVEDFFFEINKLLFSVEHLHQIMMKIGAGDLNGNN